MSSSQPSERGLAKIAQKSKEQPLIPLGILVTCGALIGATYGIRKGDKNFTQRMFRLRVAAQGFTVLACVAGSLYYDYNRRLERAEKQKLHEANTNVTTNTNMKPKESNTSTTSTS